MGMLRTFSPDEAFVVYLGGHLLGDMGFGVPEARQILSELRPWMQSKGLFPQRVSETVDKLPVKSWTISIFREKNFGFRYEAKGILARRDAVERGVKCMEERFVVEIPVTRGVGSVQETLQYTERLFHISRLLALFNIELNKIADPL
ncbi:MAG: hypothetical protein V2B18_15235 [Pseudomonadota bacterium]